MNSLSMADEPYSSEWRGGEKYETTPGVTTETMATHRRERGTQWSRGWGLYSAWLAVSRSPNMDCSEEMSARYTVVQLPVLAPSGCRIVQVLNFIQYLHTHTLL